MKSAVRAVSPSAKRNKRLEATRHARGFSPFSSSSLNTGTNAELSARSATSARTRFGTWNATVKALIPPSTPKYRAATISRRRPTMREMPVRTEKMAVDRASAGDRGLDLGRAARRRPGRPPRSASIAPVVGHGLLVGARPRAGLDPGSAFGTPVDRGASSSDMPNIKQQERRVHTAARQRLENLRWRSASKTLFTPPREPSRRVTTELIAAEHRRARPARSTRPPPQRAIHPNKAARKKAQAAKLVSAGTSA